MPQYRTCPRTTSSPSSTAPWTGIARKEDADELEHKVEAHLDRLDGEHIVLEKEISEVEARIAKSVWPSPSPTSWPGRPESTSLGAPSPLDLLERTVPVWLVPELNRYRERRRRLFGVAESGSVWRP